MEENKIVEDYHKNTENRFRNFLSKIGVVHVLVFGAICLIVYSITKNNADTKLNYFIYIIMGIAILVLWFKPNKEKKLIPDYIAKQIAQEALNKKVRENKEFAFDSKVVVTPYCHLVYENDMAGGTAGPIKWEIVFEELVNGSQYKKQGVISIHCYAGFVTGIKMMPFGYSGRESHDRDIIPVGVVQGNMKTTDYGQGLPK